MIQKCSDSARHAGLTRCVPLASTQENKRMGDEHEVKVERDAGLCREKKKRTEEEPTGGKGRFVLWLL